MDDDLLIQGKLVKGHWADEADMSCLDKKEYFIVKIVFFCHVRGILDIKWKLKFTFSTAVLFLYLAVKNFLLAVYPEARKLGQYVDHFVRFDVVDEDIW